MRTYRYKSWTQLINNSSPNLSKLGTVFIEKMFLIIFFVFQLNSIFYAAHYCYSVTSCQNVRDTLHSWIDAMQRDRRNVKNVFKEYDFFAWISEPPISLAVALAQNDEHKDFRVGNAFKVISIQFSCFAKIMILR